VTSDGYAVAEELALRAARLAKIQALRARLETEQREAQGLTDAAMPTIDEKEQRAFADADARIMLMKRGEYDYAYNAQAADMPATEPPTTSADAGYFSGDNIAADGAGIDLLIAARRSDPPARGLPGQQYTADAFAYDAARNVWLCPADKVLEQQLTPPGARGHPKKVYYAASAVDCADCPLRLRCLQPGEERRVLRAPPPHDRRDAL